MEASDKKRLMQRLRVYMPNNLSVWVDVPIIQTIPFKDGVRRGQVTAHIIENSTNSPFGNETARAREVRVQRVFNAANQVSFIDAERIQKFWDFDQIRRGQERQFTLINDDPPPQTVNSDNPHHSKKHVVRFYQNNDQNSQNWIDMEQIDELYTKDATRRGQETIRTLDWNQTNPGQTKDLGDPVNDPNDPFSPTVGFCDPNLDAAFSTGTGGNGFNPPYRFDPFQNPVNVNWNQQHLRAGKAWPFVWGGAISPLGNPWWIPVNWEFIISMYPQYSLYESVLTHSKLPQPSDPGFFEFGWESVVEWGSNANIFNTHFPDGTPTYTPAGLFNDYINTIQARNYFPGNTGYLAGGPGGIWEHFTNLLQHGQTLDGGLGTNIDTDVTGYQQQWEGDFGWMFNWCFSAKSSALGPPWGNNNATPGVSTFWCYGFYFDTGSTGYVPPALPPGYPPPP